MRIVVTGANGQVGIALSKLWKGKNFLDVHFLSRNELPLDKPAIISDILNIYQPDVIIHAAAYTAVDLAEENKEEAFLINAKATEEIAIYSSLNSCKLIYISTDYVFDGNSSEALTELSATNPVNYYGLTKFEGEQAVIKYDPTAIIIRTSWLYYTEGKNFLLTMLRLMSEKSEISVVNDQIGSPTYVGDLVELINLIINSDQWHSGIYHYSNLGKISWYDFAVEIKNIAQKKCDIKPIESHQFPTKAKRPKFSLLDKTKVQDTFNVIVPDWKDSLTKAIAIFTKN